LINVMLPWPPSANRYWRNFKGRTIVSSEAKSFKDLVKALAYTWRAKPIYGRVKVVIYAFPPDKRVRDLDNLLKITIDAIKDAGLFPDDSQIDEISISRHEVTKPGYLNLFVSEIEVKA